MAPGVIGCPGRAAHDGPRAAWAVRLPAPGGRRHRLGARRAVRRPRRGRRGHRPGRRVRPRPRRTAPGARRPARARAGGPGDVDGRRVLLDPRPRAVAAAASQGHAAQDRAVGRGERRCGAGAPHRAPARSAGVAAALRRARPGRAAASGGARARGHRAAGRAPRAAARGGGCRHAPARAHRRAGRGTRGDRERPARGRGCCCTASPAPARPRSTCAPPRRRCSAGAA